MSVVDIIVIAVCLAIGYKFVGAMIGKASGPSNDEPHRDPPPLFPARPPWHAVLGVSPDATHDEIVSAYRAQMSQYHPDKVASLGTDIRALAEQRAKEINAAYAEATGRRGREKTA